MKNEFRNSDLALGICLGLVVGLLLIGGIASVAVYYFPNLIIGSPPPLTKT